MARTCLAGRIAEEICNFDVYDLEGDVERVIESIRSKCKGDFDRFYLEIDYGYEDKKLRLMGERNMTAKELDDSQKAKADKDSQLLQWKRKQYEQLKKELGE